MAAIRFRSILFVAVVGCALAFGTAGDAAPKPAAAHIPIVQELHQTRMLMRTADHDYAGFRAKAVHQVTKAIHALIPPRSGEPNQGPPVAKSRGRMPQAASDQQLHQALKQLHAIHNQLGSLSGDGRTRASMMHIRHAIHDLHTALKIN